MVTNEVSTKKGFGPARSIAMSVVLLVVLGLAVGYVIRKSHAAKKAVPVANAPMAGLPANVPVPAGELKQMADEQAKPILEKLKTEPNDAASLIQLGDLRYDATQYKEAIFYYERALALDKKNVRVRADLGNAYAYVGEPDRAISEFQTALQYNPKHGLSLLNMGMVQWHDKGDVNAAVATWQKLQKANPQFAQQAHVEQLIAKAKEHAKMPSSTK